jgi:DNA-cytosine methyltransferase
MNVLSLFDGISCGLVALKRNQIPIEKYYACEIDKYAIQVSKKNHPEIEHLGSVVGLNPPKIDLLIGGSPCQDLSIAKKNRKGLDGDRSGLFWEYVRILKEAKPKWFILENVASMSKESKQTITEALGVEPVMINASLVSAQSRKRLFWTNIPVKGLPEDKGILLKDILQPDVEDKFFSSQRSIKVNKQIRSPDEKAICLTASSHKGVGSDGMTVIKNKPHRLMQIGHVATTNGQANKVYSPEGKSATLSNGGAGLIKIGREIGRHLNAEGKREDKPNIPITRRIETREDGKCGTLTSVTKDNLVISDSIRKLTPIECERLQGLPDDYTNNISNTQRYKCLGNAFNVDVICFILKHL